MSLSKTIALSMASQYSINMKNAVITYPNVNFAVISDLHFYDHSLGTSGAAFQKVLDSDRKLLLNSIELLDYAIGDIISSKVQFVIIPGDLVKDGELINHKLLAEKLKRFTDAGIAVYVVPGNHDINNPHAFSFSGETAIPVPSISPDEFIQVYKNFGYSSALELDINSLSYVAEPADGLYLLALDCCRYRENRPGKHPIVSGRVGKKTMAWIGKVLEDAAAKNKAVIAMVHHGVAEHWKGQAKLNPDFLVNDYINFGKFLSSHNVQLVFTGHYHAQDISCAQFDGKSIYDIETGSLIASPCPIRYLEIKDNVLDLRTETIADKLRPGTDFAANAHIFLKRNYKLAAANVLKKLKVPAKDRDYIAEALADAFVAHSAGDENPALRPLFDKSRLGFWARLIFSHQEYVLDGLWTDIPPADNNIRLKLDN